jgi:hypothetical protein
MPGRSISCGSLRKFFSLSPVWEVRLWPEPEIAFPVSYLIFIDFIDDVISDPCRSAGQKDASIAISFRSMRKFSLLPPV